MSRRKRRWLFWVVVLVVLLAINAYLGRLPEKSVLVLEVSGEIEEQKPPGLLAQLDGGVTVLHHLTDAIDTARNDDRIAGLVVKISSPGTGWAKLQELRSHVQEFRKSGKPSICYLSGDLLGNREYYLGTGCDQVWLVPTAGIGIMGMMTQSTFLRGTLDKLGIYPDFYGIAEYKTYRNQFTEKKYTPAHREANEAVLRSTYEQYVADVAKARKMKKEEFERLVVAGPYLGREALEKKLVDRTAYWDELQGFFRKKTTVWRPVELGRYKNEVKNEGMETIAVVHATGTIVVGNSDYGPSVGFLMGSDSVAADLRRAREDGGVKAIVLRVDSGGGSAVGSEIIRREVELASKVKPVVVSMSDVAGSGGYWIAMSANRIFADPSTITASIGVVFGKMNVSGLYKLLGLSTDHIVTSENATLFSAQQNFTPAQREMVEKQMQEVYANFTRGVAEGRKMKVDEVDRIGKGRIWTGTQAKGLGLVDELGGFPRALAAARELAKIDPGTKVKLVRYPVEKPLFQQLLEMDLGGGDVLAGVAAEVRRLARVSEPVQVRVPINWKIR